MTGALRGVAAALLLLVVLYGAWFAIARPSWVALVVFAAPPLLLAVACWRGRAAAAFWAGVLALAWFSHGVMVAWTRPPERGFALAEVVLALVVVCAPAWAGLREKARRRRGL